MQQHKLSLFTVNVPSRHPGSDAQAQAQTTIAGESVDSTSIVRSEIGIPCDGDDAVVRFQLGYTKPPVGVEAPQFALRDFLWQSYGDRWGVYVKKLDLMESNSWWSLSANGQQVAGSDWPAEIASWVGQLNDSYAGARAVSRTGTLAPVDGVWTVGDKASDLLVWEIESQGDPPRPQWYQLTFNTSSIPQYSGVEYTLHLKYGLNIYLYTGPRRTANLVDIDPEIDIQPES